MKKGRKRFFTFLMVAAAPLVYAEPISVFQDTPLLISYSPAPLSYGIASWYSETDPFINRHTANGEVFDDSKLTCASWEFPFGTRLEVKNLANGKSVICRVNDRGPAKRLNRLVDLTKTAFRQIGDTRKGLLNVSVKKIPRPLRNAREF